MYLKISIVSHPKTTLPEFCGGLPDFGQNYLILRDINWEDYQEISLISSPASDEVHVYEVEKLTAVSSPV